ncbi:hypothetical protein EVAR_3508_1 [Eumeta japonica]|uniref:Uncharacterized protein n=1 Tax=Eumeta variegata TaxID=151549 RepID=A0A4C1YTS0_EUMVA|nr:hypothetical protein EVAR_3508_1 [Eumeta japonica]
MHYSSAARGRPIIVEWERRKAFGGPLSSVTHRYVTERYTFHKTRTGADADAQLALTAWRRERLDSMTKNILFPNTTILIYSNVSATEPVTRRGGRLHAQHTADRGPTNAKSRIGFFRRAPPTAADGDADGHGRTRNRTGHKLEAEPSRAGARQKEESPPPVGMRRVMRSFCYILAIPSAGNGRPAELILS